MSRRGVAAVVILACWIAGMAVLVRREFFQPNTERLAEAAVRVSPGAVFYAVLQSGQQIGFASSTIDTTRDSITATDYLVADIPAGGAVHRVQARTVVGLSRALRVRTFDVEVESEAAPVRASGRVVGDSLVLLAVSAGPGASPDTQRLRIGGPILLPTLVPLAVVLGEQPKVGKSYLLPLFDPTTMAPRDSRIAVQAETTFVVNDSSVFDSSAGRWKGVQPDTLHAFRLTAESGDGFTGWVDEQGRVVRTSKLGFTLERRPYEVAFENWRMAAAKADAAGADSSRDILETTAIAANRTIASALGSLRVVLSNAELKGFDVDGGRQSLHGDTLTITREPASQLAAMYTLPLGGRRLLPAYTRAEPLLEVTSPQIATLAARIRAGSPDPRVVAERINRWVYDSLEKKVSLGVPSALQVLRTRSGDCNEHTQLYVALARAAGIPARVAAGLAYVNGKFYYHAWPEVFLNGWVAVDPTFGQFPADASHLRFVVGGLTRQVELIRLMGALHITVVHDGAGR